MKKIFYSASLFASLMLASCSQSVDSVSPETTTELSEEFGLCYPQCTAYVRDNWLSKLPPKLFTYADKKKICNAWSPAVGYAAIMPPNHIAYVTAVSGNMVTVMESNWDYRCSIASRTMNKSKIYGYWKP